ncbi:YbjN domain-containing protein [Corynebacterium sp. TA-R-1]|uniref:YbjN domain-containing protein n=1 Tax=Corynebacterium stercoris TaxID=2943490 RepID=A0ABT1G1V8_9CORY|nr:YbjN domain-containing protein [Corynebacterium stercoris]MCP1388004.1 YbjN domain-containing protein [Corynebacterium stercoris]
MGFFDTVPAQPAGGLEPLAIDRIRAIFDRSGIKYGVDDDGDLFGSWEHGFFHFIAAGDGKNVFCLRGTWFGELPHERLDEVNAFTADWNRDHFWPKAYPVVTEEGMVRVLCEHVVAYSFGLTVDQLEDHLGCGISTGSALFEALNEAFPEAKREDNRE